MHSELASLYNEEKGVYKIDIFTAAAFSALVYFIIPSIIAITIRDQIIPSDKRDWGNLLIAVLCYGVFLYPLSYFLLHFINYIFPAKKIVFPVFNVSVDYRFMLFGCFIVPIFVGAFTGILPKLLSSWLKKASHGLILHPEPTPWDFVFAQRERAFFVLIHLKSGGRIGGYYGKDSYVSSYPHPQQIYLQATWKPTRQHWEKVPGTSGVLVSIDECDYVEFFEAKSASKVSKDQKRTVAWKKIVSNLLDSCRKWWKYLQQSPLSKGKVVMVPSPIQATSSPPFGLGGFVSDAELIDPAITSTNSQQGGDAETGGQAQTTSTTSTTTEKS